MHYLTIPLRVRAVLMAFAILAVVPLPPAGGATEYDGSYSGIITCDALPGDKPLRTSFLLKIDDGRARYEREVLQANTTIPAGVTERGSGTVSPSGELVLTGAATGPRWKYQATYRGQIAGKTLRLTGTQQWQLPVSGAAHTRPCTITVSRSD